VLLSQINFGLGGAAAVFVFARAFSVALLFAAILRSQASTGLSQEGLDEDPNEVAGSHTGARSGALGIAGGLLAVAFLVPVAWVFWMSVTPSLDLYGPRGDSSGAAPPSLLLYSFMLYDGRAITGLANSAVIAGVTTAITLSLACPAAYAIARLGLRYGNGLLAAMPAVAFFPPAAVPVPMLVQLREIGVVGTQLGAIVPHTVFFLPFAVWLLATFFRELPAEVEDAARVDGARETQVLSRVILPLAAPAVFATGTFIFVLSWNEFVFASTFTFYESRPITAGLADLVAGMSAGAPPGPLAAASLLATLPPILLFLAFRRRILAGLTGDAFGETADGARGSRALTLPKAGLWAATAVLLLAQAWALTLFVRYGAGALSFPYSLNYSEGPLLDQAARVLDFQNIYRVDLSEPPFTVSNYPPVFVLLQAPLVWLFGPEYWYGRAISLAGAVATAVFIGLILHALTRDRIAAVAGGSSFLAVPYVVQWSSLARVDLLGLALSWAGLYVAVRQPGRRRYVIAAALLMVAAIYTRQTYALATPLAGFVWLLSRRRLRGALTLAAVTGGVSLVLLGVPSAITGGGFFFHTVTSNVNEFRWEQVTFSLSDLFATMPLTLAGGVAFLVLAPRSGMECRWLVGPYLLGAVATALLIGKAGSDVNYLLELSAALSLAAGALLARYAKRPGPRTAMLLAVAVQTALLVQTSQLGHAFREQCVVAREDEIARLEEIVDDSKGPVLADEYMGLLPLEGRRIHLQPFEMTQLAREGKWDQGPLLRRIGEKRFSAILIFEPPGARALVEDRWTYEMLDQIEANYEPSGTFALTRVYLPKE
jgi:multiple sugar transport system permease protein